MRFHLIHYVLPNQFITRFFGFLAKVKIRLIKNYFITRFIKAYRINMDEALHQDLAHYACFNDFFIRHLKPGARPIAKATAISPIDGFVSEVRSVQQGQLLQAKGLYYSVQELLACDEIVANQFTNGQFATFYLSPKDYHRVHMPIAGKLKSMVYLPGALFSVQPTCVKGIPKLFARNSRLVIYFETKLGLMAIVLVGAVNVGAIGTSWHGDVKRTKNPVYFDYSDQDIALNQADELGYFKLGSTVIILFEKQATIEWNRTLIPGSAIQLGNALI